jgi:hypothetical protein
MFNTSENRIGAFAGLVALVLVLALTAMAFTALEPGQRARPQHRLECFGAGSDARGFADLRFLRTFAS